jgi:hypothetical protein
MRIIIELDSGTRVSGIATQSDASSDGAIDVGPPRMSDHAANPSGAPRPDNGASDAGGPPAALLAQIEAARSGALSPITLRPPVTRARR